MTGRKEDFDYKGLDKLFLQKNGEILWIYFNEQEIQWVCNRVSEDVLQKALDGYSFRDLEDVDCVNEIFDFIQGECREYCVDWEDEDFQFIAKVMEKPKGFWAEDLTGETLERLIDYYSCTIAIF